MCLFVIYLTASKYKLRSVRSHLSDGTELRGKSEEKSFYLSFKIDDYNFFLSAVIMSVVLQNILYSFASLEQMTFYILTFYISVYRKTAEVKLVGVARLTGL